MLGFLSTGFCAFAQGPVSKKPKPLPTGSEFVRLLDPDTETPLIRLTSPASNSFLPAATNQFVSAKDKYLVFSSDRTGGNAPFRLDLRTGVLTQLANIGGVQPQSLSLDPTNHSLRLLDGSTLEEVEVKSKRVRVLADEITAFSFGSSAADAIVVRKGKLYRLSDQATVLAEGASGWCAVRPGGTGCLWGREVSSEERELWYMPLNGPRNKAIMLAKGHISSPCWSPDGRAVLFLRETLADGILRSAIHEVFPETCAEARVANTSQFAAFAPNEDGSVFVGASRSKAQPTIVLLLRASGRELTLCEHRAKDAAKVSPVFSPDSRRVYFQSDREGKSALYSVNVESLIEST